MTEQTEQPEIIISFQCPICDTIHNNQRWHFVDPEGRNYWPCSTTCHDVAASGNVILPYLGGLSSETTWQGDNVEWKDQ